MRNALLKLLSAALVSSMIAAAAHASLVGSPVTGSLTFGGDSTNYFDPLNGFVPPTGYLNSSSNTVVVSATATEFGFDDGSSLISANVAAGQLIVSDTIEFSGDANSFELTFTDPAFAGLTLGTIGTSVFSPSSLVGNTITLDFTGGSVTAGQTFATTFNVTAAATPEPSTLVLTATAMAAGAAAWARRGRKRLA